MFAAGPSYLNGLWAGTRWHDPLMQGLHFTWSVSTTVTPLIIQPFLAERLPDQLAGQPPGMIKFCYLVDQRDYFSLFG